MYVCECVFVYVTVYECAHEDTVWQVQDNKLLIKLKREKAFDSFGKNNVLCIYA